MRPLFSRSLAALTLAGAASLANAESAPMADWTFSEAANTTLNLTANTGSGMGGTGGTWDVAIPGVGATGAGALSVRNGGGGGSGTRTSYADFGPVSGPSSGQVTSGIVTLYSTFSGWGLAGSSGATFRLALVEGNDFTTAQYSLAAGPGGMSLSAAVDPDGNGSDLAGGATFPLVGSQALTVRLSLNLDSDSYTLAYSTGSGFVLLGSAAIDSFTSGVNSLRLSLQGDFSGGAQSSPGLTIDRIWVTQGPVAAVPEPGQAMLWLTGLGCVAGLQMRRIRPV